LICVAAAILCAGAFSQAFAQPASAAPTFELLGTSELNEVEGATFIGGIPSWHADKAKERGLVISLKMTFPAGVTEVNSGGLVLTWGTGPEAKHVTASALTVSGAADKGGLWLVPDPKVAATMNLNAQEGKLEASFLYAVPPTVLEVALTYKGKVVLKRIALNWKPA